VGGYGYNRTTLGGIGSIGSSAPAPVRLSSQPIREVPSFSGSDRAQLCRPSSPIVQAPLHAAAAACSPFKLASQHNLELRLNALNLQHEQLTEEVAKIKDGFANEDTSLFSDDREGLLAEIDELMNETYSFSAKNEEMLAQRADLQVEFQASSAQVGELKAEFETLRLSEEQREAASAQAGDSLAMELQVSAMTEEVKALRDGNSELRWARSREQELEAKVKNLANENERLVARIIEGQQEIERQTQQRATATLATNHAPTGAACPESHLRTVLTAVGNSTGDLQQAISGVETLLDEARRKLAAKRLREHHAALEPPLHAAIERPEKGVLEQDILAARPAQVEKQGCVEG